MGRDDWTAKLKQFDEAITQAELFGFVGTAGALREARALFRKEFFPFDALKTPSGEDNSYDVSQHSS